MQNLFDQLTSINLFKDIVVPAMAAWGALWIAMRKFKHERLWQDKYASYQRVLEAVEAIRYWGDEVSSETHMLPSVGHFDGKTPAEVYAAAQREVVRQTTVGTLLLSREFISKLRKFSSDFYDERYSESDEHYDDDRDEHLAYGNHATRVRKIADAYLSELVALAREDLGA